jgi:hypothetical protein
VVREYIGGGMLGELAAHQDKVERRQREEEIAYWREEQEHFEQNMAFVGELEAAAEVLTRAHLLASGCHQHKGQWRRQRGP